MSLDRTPDGKPRSSLPARWPWAAGVLVLALFLVLLAVRMDWIPRSLKPAGIQAGQAGGMVERDLWMSILQNGRKIGYTHRVTESSPEGWKVGKMYPCGSTPWGIARTSVSARPAISIPT